MAILSLPATAGAQPTALSGVIASPAVKCLQARKPADPEVPAPKVVSTFPARGAVVRPGRLIVRITFDLPMACSGTFIDALPLKAPFPEGRRVVYTSPDHKTFRIEGFTDGNTRYGLWLNLAPLRDFQGLSGQPLGSYNLTFSTSAGPPVTTEADALAQDKGP